MHDVFTVSCALSYFHHYISILWYFNCCFTVHFDKYKIILSTNALFIKNIKCYNVYLSPTCLGSSWTIIREYTFVPR
jgi:hypothetical protein